MGPVRPRLVPVSTSCSPFQDSRPVSTTRPLFVDPGDIDSHSRLLDSSSRLLRLTTPNNPNLRFPSPPPTPYSLSPTPRPVSPPPRPPRLLSRVATGLGTSSYVTRSAIEVLAVLLSGYTGFNTTPGVACRPISVARRFATLVSSTPNHGISSTTPDGRTTPPQRHLERRSPHLVRRDLDAPDNGLDLQPAVGLPSNTGSLVSWRPLCRVHGPNLSWGGLSGPN